MTQDSLENSSGIFIDWSILPYSELHLAIDEVHIWHASLEEIFAAKLYSVLDENERERASRFYFEKDRKHFTVARGLLRTILSSYLKIDPKHVSFCYGDKGKPALTNTNEENPIQFNLAHSHGMALFAFSRNRALGVDLEFIRDALAAENIAERFFSRAEVKALRGLSQEQRSQAFFNCWTRKEAYIKALGEGLFMELNEFDVSLVPGDEAALLNNYKEPGEVLRWSLQSVPVKTGYVAALCTEGAVSETKHFYLRFEIG